jgi:WD40 repeat protein
VILSAPRFSPDGTRFAIPTSNGVTVYETGTWNIIAEIDSDMPVNALAFSPDGKRLAIAFGGKIHFWEEIGGDTPKTIELGPDFNYYITDLEFSPDGALLAVGYWPDISPYTTVFQTSDWQPAYTVEGTKPLFSSDSQRLSTVSAGINEEPYVSLYSAAPGMLIHRWGGVSVAFLPEGELLIEAGGATRVVETQAGTYQARLALNGRAPARSPDGRHAAVFEPGVVRLYSLADGALLRTLELPDTDRPLEGQRLLFLPDGQYLAASTSVRSCDSCDPIPGPILIWQLAGDDAVHELPAPATLPWLGSDPGGQTLVVTTSNGVRRYDPGPASLVGSLNTFSDYISELALSPDGKQLAVGYSESGRFGLRVLDLATRNEPRSYIYVPRGVSPLDWWKMAFSPDGKLVGLGGHFWRVETGDHFTLPSPELTTAGPAISLAFNPDGQTVTLGLPEGKVQICELSLLSCTQTLAFDFPGDVVSLASSPDGTQLAAAYAYTLDGTPSPAAQVWQIPAGVPQVRLQAANIAFVTYSPDGRLIATITVLDETYQRNFPYGVIQLWTDTGELRATFPPKNVMRLAFSPDGQTLAAGLSDGRVQLWSIDGYLIQQLDTSQEGVIAGLAFTPDGQQLVIASGTGVIELWSR